MTKILATVDDCKQCQHSTCFATNSVDYSLVVCDKTRRVLLIVDKGTVGSYKIEVPDDCPLPYFVETKTD